MVKNNKSKKTDLSRTKSFSLRYKQSQIVEEKLNNFGMLSGFINDCLDNPMLVERYRQKVNAE